MDNHTIVEQRHPHHEKKLVEALERLDDAIQSIERLSEERGLDGATLMNRGGLNIKFYTHCRDSSRRRSIVETVVDQLVKDRDLPTLIVSGTRPRLTQSLGLSTESFK